MVQGWRWVWTGALGAAAVTAVTLAGAQQQQKDTTAPAQATTTSAQPNSSIPDAPRPQTLPNLRSITPAGAAVTPRVPSAADNLPDTPGPSLQSSRPAAAAAQNTAEDDDPNFRVPPDMPITSIAGAPANFVEVPFTVKDSKGQLVPGLTYRDVRVFENGLRQSPKLFSTDPVPLSVALVIDQSVDFKTMEKVNNALSALQGAFTPYDEVTVFTYNNGVRQQTAFTAAQSARLSAVLQYSKGKGREPLMLLGGPLSEGINKNGQAIDPNTTGHPNRAPNSFEAAPKEFHTLNDAILAAAAETTKAAKGRRRIVYVVSDGKEYGSKAREKNVIKFCQQNKVAVWATLVGDSAEKGLGFLDRIHLPLTMRDDVLPRYAAATGGQVDAEFRTAGIERSFAKLTEEVRTQYTIGYYTHEPIIDGKYRKIEVRVARPNLTVIAKEGYYPSAETRVSVPVTPSAVP